MGPRLAVLALVFAGCTGTGPAGRLTGHLVRNTARAVPGRPVALRSIDGTQFAETEVAVEMDVVPGPVRALRAGACPNREGAPRFSQLEIDGEDAFKVTTGQGLRTCAVVGRPNGERVRVEEAVDPTTLPGPIVQAVDGLLHGDYQITEAWRVRTDGGDETMELLVRRLGRDIVLVVATSGAIRLRLRRLPATIDLPDR